jgi:hypothetical protein
MATHTAMGPRLPVLWTGGPRRDRQEAWVADLGGFVDFVDDAYDDGADGGGVDVVDLAGGGALVEDQDRLIGPGADHVGADEVVVGVLTAIDQLHY